MRICSKQFAFEQERADLCFEQYCQEEDAQAAQDAELSAGQTAVHEYGDAPVEGMANFT